MSAGKAAAQAVHAAMLLQNLGVEFADNYKRTVIILEAENAEQIRNLEEYCDNAGVATFRYIDEGVNEIAPYSVTSLVVEPIDADDEETRGIFATFKLYNSDEDFHDTALRGLRGVCRDYRDYLHGGDYTPRVIKKAIKFLEKNK